MNNRQLPTVASRGTHSESQEYDIRFRIRWSIGDITEET